ncbi:helix-turn-helix domain-containing protein [Sphaerimonospora sp. CA-214678]|uniref:helix-turn-helix domain-containing protein n=1 Tax=Sphaerimonospora sp. CA-214678 TaxID=3240029 RepID=UPI003D93587A
MHVTSQGLVGERIKMIRRQRGLSQAQLAHPELSDSYVSLIESGKRTPTPAVLELLAQKLDCSLTFLVNGVTAEQMEDLELGLRFARLALENGEVAEARRRYAELLEDNNLVGLASLRQDARYGYALAAEAGGDLPEAIAALNTLREGDTEGQSPERRIQIALALCRCHRNSGDFATAVRIGEETLGPASAEPSWNDDLIELGSTLLSVYYERGDLLRARQFAAELLAAAERLGTPRAIVAACWNAARTAELVGADEEAMPLMERAMAIQSENGEPRNLARLRGAYATLLLRARPAEALTARDLLVRVLHGVKESAASRGEVPLTLLYLARAEMELGHLDEAAEHAQAALDLAAEGTSRAVLTDAHLVLGQAHWMRHRDEDATAELNAAVQKLEDGPQTRKTAENWLAAAEIHDRVGDRARSIEAYHRALACAGL